MSENTPYYQISMDQYVLVMIMQTLLYAKNCIAEGAVEVAKVQVDFAWSILPNSVRDRFPLRPTEQLDQRLLHQIKSDIQMLQQATFRKMSSAQRERIRQEQEISITTDLVLEYCLKIPAALDSAGLYIKGDVRIKPTADKKANQAPPLTKLPENLPR